MRKRNILFAGIAGLVLMGGAIGVGANSIAGDKNLENTGSAISMDEAKKIALHEAGGKLKGIELEKDDGRLIYEIELISDEKGRKVDIDIDAKTGKIIKVDQDDDHDNEPVTNKEAKVSMEDAIAVAVKDTPGEVEGSEFDPEDGYYEIEIQTGKNEVEIKVDSETGKIITKDND